MEVLIMMAFAFPPQSPVRGVSLPPQSPIRKRVTPSGCQCGDACPLGGGCGDACPCAARDQGPKHGDKSTDGYTWDANEKVWWRHVMPQQPPVWRYIYNPINPRFNQQPLFRFNFPVRGGFSAAACAGGG